MNRNTVSKFQGGVNGFCSLMLILSTMGVGGCVESPENANASLGGNVAGFRGEIQVVFFNNTPNQPAFTFGTYDDMDRENEPDFAQFGLDTNDLQLEPGATSAILGLQCGRVFAIGSPDLLSLIDKNLPDAELETDALVEGIEFYDNTEELPVAEGSAPPFEARLGVDFPCSALLLIYLEIDDSGSNEFRVAFQLIPSESDR